jgi:hypothetical protein
VVRSVPGPVLVTYASNGSRRSIRARGKEHRGWLASCDAVPGPVWGLLRNQQLPRSHIGGPRLIQVHHLDPLGVRQREVPVDPVRDLQPLCPSCHALLHLKSPPMTVAGARSFPVSRMAPSKRVNPMRSAFSRCPRRLPSTRQSPGLAAVWSGVAACDAARSHTE